MFAQSTGHAIGLRIQAAETQLSEMVSELRTTLCSRTFTHSQLCSTRLQDERRLECQLFCSASLHP